jgi:hypothetical protein
MPISIASFWSIKIFAVSPEGLPSMNPAPIVLAAKPWCDAKITVASMEKNTNRFIVASR